MMARHVPARPSEENARRRPTSVETAADCPVAQLPVGTFPDFPMADGTPTALTYYYRGFVPYMLEPDQTASSARR